LAAAHVVTLVPENCWVPPRGKLAVEGATTGAGVAVVLTGAESVLLCQVPGLFTKQLNVAGLAPTQVATVTVVAEMNVVGRDEPLQFALTPLMNGALALAVNVIVSFPIGTGFGDIAVKVGPGASGFTYV
jgi:hypothetical protein